MVEGVVVVDGNDDRREEAVTDGEYKRMEDDKEEEIVDSSYVGTK